jgi:hypothetical protein
MKWMEQPCQQQQGAGGIINQRDEIRQAIGPGTANYDRLPTTPIDCKAIVATITAKGLADWSGPETIFAASMIQLAVSTSGGC